MGEAPKIITTFATFDIAILESVANKVWQQY